MVKKEQQKKDSEEIKEEVKTNKTIELASFVVLAFFLCFLFVWSTFYYTPEAVSDYETPTVEASFSYGDEVANVQEPAAETDMIADLIEDLVISNEIEFVSEEEHLQQEITELVSNGVSFNFKPQAYSSVYELYEEDLPTDIYEDQAADSGTAGIDIEVVKKPPYFGELPVIAIVIDDMGVSPKRTKDINSLFAPITSSFLTYSNSLSKQIQDSKDAGHDVIVHVPMEAKTKKDVAPDVLTVEMNKEEVQSSLEKMLKPFNGIKGINNHMGSKFTESKKHMSYVMEFLKSRDMYFLDSKTSPKSKGTETAKEYGVDYASRNVFLDNNNNYNYIMGQLKQTEDVAKRNGYAVAIGHPKSQTYLALKDWIPTAEEKGFKLVKLSIIIDTLNPKHENPEVQ